MNSKSSRYERSKLHRKLTKPETVVLHYCPTHGRVDSNTVESHPQRTHDCFYCKQMLIIGRRVRAKRTKES